MTGVTRTAQGLAPSATSSSAPVTVTGCAVCQSVAVNVSAAGVAVPSLVFWLSTATVTAAVGSVASCTVNVAVVAPSVTLSVVACAPGIVRFVSTITAGVSSSVVVTATSTCESKGGVYLGRRLTG